MAIDNAFVIAVLLLATVLSSMNVATAHIAVKIPDECDQVVFSIMHCTSYMIAGGNLTEPDSRCCPGVQKVVDAGPECLCASLLLEEQMGFKLDMTRALGLRKLCRVENDDHSILECVATSPSPSPSSPMPENAPSPAPTSAPATSPGAPSTEAPKSSSVHSPSAPPVLPTPTSPGPATAKASPGPQVNPADSGAGDVSIPVMAILVAFAVAVLSHLEY